MAGVYHKQYLPNYGVFDENRYFQAGDGDAGLRARRTSVSAVNICEDIWYPDRPDDGAGAGRRRAGRHHQRLALPRRARRASREKMLATRAADDLVCLAFVNLVGGQDELVFDGAVLDRSTSRASAWRAARPFEEDLVVADLDLDAVFRARLHDSRRRKEKLRATAPAAAGRCSRRCRRRQRPPLAARAVAAARRRSSEVYEALVLGTRDYVTQERLQATW